MVHGGPTLRTRVRIAAVFRYFLLGDLKLVEKPQPILLGPNDFSNIKVRLMCVCPLAAYIYYPPDCQKFSLWLWFVIFRSGLICRGFFSSVCLLATVLASEVRDSDAETVARIEIE